MREFYLKLYGITEEQVPQLRSLSDMKYSEVNEICSILLNKKHSCGYIEFADDKKDFLCAIFKVEEPLSDEKYERIEMGFTINSGFRIDHNWNYVTKRGTGITNQPLHNHNKITAYLLKQKFDVFGLKNTEE